MSQNRLTELINKFWDGKASRQECAELLDFLENSEPTDEAIQATKPDNLQNLLDPGRKEALLRSIESKIGNHEKGNVVSLWSVWYKRIAVCAALLAIFFVCKIITEKLNTGHSTVIPQRMASVIRLDTLSNNGSKPASFKLSDQSSVLLYPNSQICFEHSFERRNVILKGKAYFKVRHDADKIFTVTTGDIVTTDIGTEFEIDAGEKDKVAIRLIEGKVKVGILPESKLVMRDQYLDKNEQLKINTTSDKVVLERSSLLPEKKAYSKRLVFSKTPLNIVFGKISTRYNCKINFKAEDIAKLTFTGNIEPEDSLPDILNIICAINNLSFSKSTNGFMISKP